LLGVRDSADRTLHETKASTITASWVNGSLVARGYGMQEGKVRSREQEDENNNAMFFWT